ncbi:hypothetical protein B0H16DRAFT_1415622 [Mycena metata]|uniref:BTB domain-containing protein n=1 Tax=Mycena metata TaxID=1033252 RepID=A0AAD7J910_9AGAR|nr:hypothetical protein B0H16DRAFT_1415622 [Mycena metata]
MTTPKTPSVSSKFSFADSDITFKSSDSVLFHVHRKNLDVCTEGFPPAGISTDGSIVELTETSDTLELLFRFVYPERHPGLDTTPFEVLAPLAEAAEKYQVFPAMNICHIRLRDMAEEHPVEVAVYASKHDYPSLICEVAPMMIAMPAETVMEILPAHLVLPWTRYVEEWANVLHSALIPPEGWLASHRDNAKATAFGAYQAPATACSWPYYVIYCLQRLGVGVTSLCSLDDVFDMTTPPANRPTIDDCCQRALVNWRRQIEEAITQIPKFSDFA